MTTLFQHMMLRAQINLQKRQLNVPNVYFNKIFFIKDGISRLFFVPIYLVFSHNIKFINILHPEFQQSNPH